eukprot:gnl/MRDRNA2_/MRDRNA2_19025_c0_seq1.p1 gnl/MRDRNA2_/MRDRNA2_19025_c0~~gnl/MRDRNA2_/MRDRNA2_19025_c0_seq1.p1  ORF type:complete len:116 (+),score=9.65 gnl/MRDRNA2_/MRDRNA2_19025_c0_seq1:144-491(+)
MLQSFMRYYDTNFKALITPTSSLLLYCCSLNHHVSPGFFIQKTANAHAVLERSCSLKSLIDCTTALSTAANSYESKRTIFAKIHAALTRSRLSIWRSCKHLPTLLIKTVNIGPSK